MLEHRDHAVEAPQGLIDGSALEVSDVSASPADGEAELPAIGSQLFREPPSPPRAMRLLLSLGTFGLVGFSFALFVRSLGIASKTPAFYTGNTLGAPARTQLLLTLAAGLFVPPLVAVVYALWKRGRANAVLERVAKLVCPLVLSGIVPGLYVWQFGQKNTLQYLFVLVAMAFAGQYLLRISVPEWLALRWPGWFAWPFRRVDAFCRAQSRWLPLGIVLLAASGYTLYTGFFTIHQHRIIQTFAFDLGIYDNLMYGAMSGKPFRSPVLFGPGIHNYISGHAEYGMLLFLPIYALRPGAETMLLMQAAVLGFAAVPLFLFARTRLPQSVAVLLSIGYLLYAPLHGPAFYDFHWLPLAIFFHFWLYFALATRRDRLAIAMVLVLLSMREDIAMGLCVLGAFLALSGERVRFGLVLSIVSVTWFAINKFVIMRLAGSWWFENLYAELFADGEQGYGAVFKTILSNPTFTLATLAREPKLVYIFHLLVPLAFLPVRRVPLVALLLPGFFFTLLTTGYWPTTSIAFQYTTHWIPYLFLATTISLFLMNREPNGRVKRIAAMGTLALVLTSHSYNFGALLQRESFTGGFLAVNFKLDQEQTKRYDALMSLVRQIPRSASVAATEFLNPHISARVEAYTFRYELPVVDYILVSRLEVSGETAKMLGAVLRKADYGLAGEAGNEFYLFKKGAPAGNMTAALSRLGVSLEPRLKKHH